MKKANFKSKKLVLLSVVMVIALLSVIFTTLAFAADGSDNVWTFSSDSVKDSLYVKEHFTSLPRAYEAEVNFPSGSYGSSSPIIANWANSDTRDSFGFQIRDNGSPAIYYYQTYYDAETSTTKTDNNIMVKFNYSVIGKGWVRIAVTCETESGSSVYKLYVNGVLEETIYDYPYVHTLDPIFSQDCTRELSIGNDGKNYFKGQLRNVAVYKDALTEAEAANTAKANMQSGDENLMAYYDATMSGNSANFIKDQTDNGHDASKAFFERTDELDDYAYSFAFIGDTQFLVEKDVNDKKTEADRNYAKSIYDWLVANKDSKKIQRVFGLGDITDDNNEAQWKYALALHQKLVDANIPFSIVPGNHDDYTTPAANYNKYFADVAGFVKNGDAPEGEGEDQVLNYGYYIDGRLENFYTNFTVGKNKYMVIGIQYGAPDDILAWANSVVAANSDRQVIVLTHSLFNSKGEWAYPDTTYQTTTSRKYLNNGIDIWNKFISLHENIIIAAAGHISSDTIKHGQSVGVNGNVVNTFLINPQGFDKATSYDTGMVAMFYFSEDGSRVQVEYVSTVKTVRAQDADPSADDVLYHERDSFEFEINSAGTGSTKTEYGTIFNSDIIGNAFAVFENGEFVSAHPTWNSVTSKVAAMFEENNNRDIQILLLKDYENSDDALATNALNYANGLLTIDLGTRTFTRSDTFLSFDNSADITNVAPSNVIFKNGIIRSKSGTIIDTRINNNGDYTAQKVYNLTVYNVTFGYAASEAAPSGAFYQASPDNASADHELGATTNITLNNCTFDLKTNVPSSMKLFNLSDTPDRVDVNLSISGGNILVNDIAVLNSVTFYLLDGGDSVVFGEYDGAFTKVHTPASGSSAHHTGKFPMADKEGCFVEISDSVQISQAGDKGSVYELTSITFKSGDFSATADITQNAAYLSAIDYPFLVFDDKGNFCGAFDSLLGTNSGAMGSAIVTALANGDTAYIIMRRDYTFTKSESYSDLAYADGTVVIEMNGHSLIADKTRGSTYMFDSYAKCDASGNAITYPSYFVFKNGSIETYGTSVIRFQSVNKNKDTGAYADVSKKLMSWTFEDVTFGLVSGSTYDRFFHISNSSVNKASDANAPVAPLALNFNNCTFDLQTVQPNPSNDNNAFYVFRTNFVGTTDIKADIRINGGGILAKALEYKVDSVAKSICLDNFSDADGSTMRFGKGREGEYFKIVVPDGTGLSIGVEDPATKTITKYNLDNKLVKKSDSGTDVALSLISKGTKYTYAFVASAATPYGDIPEKYADAEQYPFLIFDQHGNCYAANTFLGTSGAMATAVSVLNADTANTLDAKTGKYSGTVYVLVRDDYTLSSSEVYADYSYAKGTVVVDLNNHVLTSGADRGNTKYVFDSTAKADADGKAITYPTYVTVKNGRVETKGSPIMRFYASNKNADVSKKLISWTFEGVTLGVVEGSSYTRFFNVSYSAVDTGSGGTVAPLELNLNDCIYDFKTAQSSAEFYILRTNFANRTHIDADVRINGGKILASSLSKLVLDNFDNYYGSTMYFGAGSDGEYLKVVLPNGTSFTRFASTAKETASGTDIKFYKASTANGEDTYTFCFDTKYGTAPAKYEDKAAYPFFVFNADGSFKTAASEWATDSGTSALSSSKATGATVLMRRDFDNKQKQYNNLSHTKDVTIDLDGYTLTNTGYTLFMAQKKAQSGVEQDSKITIMNGTVIIGKRALVKMDTSTTTTSGKYGFDFVFEDLTIELSNSVQSTYKAFVCEDEFAAGDPIQYCNFTFNNCVFDLTNAKDAYTFFDVSDSCCRVSAIVNGGSIKTSAYGLTVWKDYQNEPETVTAHPESSLTFGKEGGKYTEIIVPDGADLPITSVNGGTLGFVKVGEENGNSVYTLAPVDALTFVPKMSLTLDRDLILNVYVPAKAFLNSFTLDGVEYTDLEVLKKVTVGEEDYYLVSISLDAKSAARDVVLRANVTLGEKSAVGTFKFGIIKYAEKILADGGDIEKTLVSDVLSYVRAAYAYFKTEDAETVSRINAILGENYDASNAPVIEGSANATTSGLKSATFSLDGTPAMRFYLADGADASKYAFFIDGTRVKTETSADGTYIDIDVYAYALCETVTYTIDGVESGSFHINTYYEWSKTQNNENLVNLVARFWKYLQSARAYRDSVVEA